MAFEWVIMGYLLITLAIVLVMYNKMADPYVMISMRARVLAITVALWGVYRMMPCTATRTLRVIAHLAMLSWWYPDTFELNRGLPNLDHIFASVEQTVFGCQPALLFSQNFNSTLFSELMHLGYSSYYVFIFVVPAYYLFCRREEFERVAFVIVAAFFIHYVIFDLLPVSGPQYYYHVVGEDQIAQGVFPNIHDYFHHSWDGQSASLPGHDGQFFRSLVELAHRTGERPTAAFPSSHVSIMVLLLLLIWHGRGRILFFCLLPLGILMFFATFYIKAHYAIDAIAGLASGVLSYWLLMKVTSNTKSPSKTSRTSRTSKTSRTSRTSKTSNN